MLTSIAGDRGAIKLLDTAQGTCYSDIPAHTKPVRALAFSPTQPNRLLSRNPNEEASSHQVAEMLCVGGGEDGNILLWEIASPPARYESGLTALKYESERHIVTFAQLLVCLSSFVS